ncbi:hypothetical protein VP01_4423g1, partial [Puccinia sorghi]
NCPKDPSPKVLGLFCSSFNFETCVPSGLHTITKNLKLDPELEEYVFCRKCYSLYDIKTAPSECGFQETESLMAFREELFSPAHLYSLEFIGKASLQHIQKPAPPNPHLFNPTSFLDVPQVETWIAEWSKKLSSESKIVDYHQSNARKTLYSQPPSDSKSSSPSHLKLDFALFVDSLGNKLLASLTWRA